MKIRNFLKLTVIYDWWKQGKFAQFGEDIILEELFGDKKKGFYVEVGAFHPKVFSNTYRLYKRGWQGICVEPNPEVKKMFGLVRPRDIFVNCGVGVRKDKGIESEKLKYFVFDEAATNTFSKEQVVENKKVGRRLIKTIKVPIRSLEEILDSVLIGGQKIDLLSVDVEGMDYSVLKSNNWKKYRPYVVVCEELDGRGESGSFLKGLGYGLVQKVGPSLIFKDKKPAS